MIGPKNDRHLGCEVSRYLRLPHRGICTLQPFLSVQTKHKRLLSICSKGCTAAYSSTMSTSQGKISTSSLMQVSVGQQRDRAIPEDLLSNKLLVLPSNIHNG